MDALLGIDQAQNFTEFRRGRAAGRAVAESDLRRHRRQHRLPVARSSSIRGAVNGTTPSPGWDPRFDWKGLIPFAELPYVYNPPSGFIVAANHPIIGHSIRTRSARPTRTAGAARRSSTRSADTPPLTNGSAEQLFYDDTIRFAADLVPDLLKMNVRIPWVVEGQQTLVGWDYSSAGLSRRRVLQRGLHDILERTFRDQMPEEQWPTGGDRGTPWCDPAGRAEQRVVGRRTTPDVVETAGRHPAGRDDRRAQGDHLLDGPGHRRVAVGQAAPGHPAHQTLGTSGIAPIERLFNRGDYRSAVVRQWSTRWR